MTRTPPAVGVIPLPKRGNALRINRLRQQSKLPQLHVKLYLPEPSNDDESDHSQCENCHKPATLDCLWLFLDSYICDGCMRELIEQGMV